MTCEHYKYHRGCEPCRIRALTDGRRRRVLAIQGKLLPRHDVAPVLAHIQALRAAGMAITVIADRAGLNRQTLANLVYGNRAFVMGPTAQAILAVQPESVVRLGTVPAIATARRIQALAAIGWSMTEQARRTGLALSALSHIANHPDAGVTTAVAEKVSALYDELYALDGTSQQARRNANRRAWAPPWAWTDGTISDPSASPNLDGTADGTSDVVAVERALAGSLPWADLNDAERMELVRRFERLDISQKALAERVGVTSKVIWSWRGKLLGQLAREAAA